MMLIELLKELGVKVEKNSKNSFSFSSSKINLSYLNSSDFFEKEFNFSENQIKSHYENNEDNYIYK